MLYSAAEATFRMCRYSLTPSADSLVLCSWGLAASGSARCFCAMLFARSNSFLAFGVAPAA